MNSIRFGGLASGIDTESIIKQLMNVERTKVDKVSQQKQLSVWRREQFQAINRKLANFIVDSKVAFGLAGTSASGVFLNNSVNSMTWVKSATSSNPDAVSVSANANAARGTYQVKVNSLASNWSSASGADLGSTKNSGDALSTQLSAAGLAANDRINFTITTNTGSLTIDRSAGDLTMRDLVRQINTAENLGVTAVYDSSTDRFFLQTNNTGAANTLQITDNSMKADGTTPLAFIAGAGSLLKLQHETTPGSGTFAAVASGTEYAGRNASINFGAATNIEFASNDFTVNNIRFSLKETTAANFQVNVNPDVEGAYNKIKEFVDNYNKIVDELDALVSQKREKGYLPLTETQKEAMKDKEIEMWEERAQKGLLGNNAILGRIGSSVRSGLYQPVEGVTGAYSLITQIGITTEAYSGSSAGGRLQINEQELKNALQKDVEGVLELLFKQPDAALSGSESNLSAAQITQKRAQSGLLNRMFDNMTVGIKEIVSQAGPGDDGPLLRKVNTSILIEFVTRQSSISILDRSVLDFDKQTNNLERLLSSREDAYWKRYTAMEKALSQMDTQMSWMMQQMGQKF